MRVEKRRGGIVREGRWGELGKNGGGCGCGFGRGKEADTEARRAGEERVREPKKEGQRRSARLRGSKSEDCCISVPGQGERDRDRDREKTRDREREIERQRE